MNTLQVCAAVIVRGDEILLSTRPPGKSLAGMWEFPGGKIDPGESFAQCLVREIREELCLDIIVLDKLYTLSHIYPERKVMLHFFRCIQKNHADTPRPNEGQDMKRIKLSLIDPAEMLPADFSFMDYLKKYGFF